MGEQRISDADMERLRDLLPQNNYQGSNRGAFYVEYTRALGQYGGTRDARQTVLFESRVSTYSGHVGGAAIIGNRLAQLNAPTANGLSLYDVTLDFFSYDVASRLLQAIEADRNRPGGTGILNGAEIPEKGTLPFFLAPHSCAKEQTMN